MAEETPPPTREELQSLLDKLLPANEEMDHPSALVIINRAGVDHYRYTERLKARLEAKAEEIRSNGDDIPPRPNQGNRCSLAGAAAGHEKEMLSAELKTATATAATPARAQLSAVNAQHSGTAQVGGNRHLKPAQTCAA